MDCTLYEGQTRIISTSALVKALRMVYDEATDPVFWPNPEGTVIGTHPGKTATQRQPRPRGPPPVRLVASGVAENVVEVATTTTATAVTTVVEAGEARRVQVISQAAAVRKILFTTTRTVVATLPEATKGGGTAQENVQRRRLVNVFPVAFGLQH